MRWWMLAGAQYALAKAPCGPSLYSVLQRRFGELKNVRGSGRFDRVEDFLTALIETDGDLREKSVVEFGTGWVPVLPMALAAAGARVFSYDISELVTDNVALQTRDELFERLPSYAAAAKQDSSEMSARIGAAIECNSFAEVCQAMGMHYDGRADTTALDHATDSVDAVVSSLVLQCMPIDAVEAVLAESFRILKPGGFAVHRIRMTDENAAHDASKNHFDYLKYSQRDYDRWFNHRLKYLNRLRASQFLAMMRTTGFDVYHAEKHVDLTSLEYVSTLSVDRMFTGLTPDDLATTNLNVVLQKPVPWPADRDADGRLIASSAAAN